LLCFPARPEASAPPVMPSADPLYPLVFEDEDPFIPSKGWAEMMSGETLEERSIAFHH